MTITIENIKIEGLLKNSRHLIYLGSCSGQRYAMKTYRKNSPDFQTEIEFLSVQHPHILLPLMSGKSTDLQGLPFYLTLTEYCPHGTLQDMLDRLQAPSTELIRTIFWSLTEGLDFLHNELKIVHGNINSDHIYIDSKFHFRLGNFSKASFCENFEGELSESLVAEDLTFENQSKLDIYMLGTLFLGLANRLNMKDEALENLVSEMVSVDPCERPDIRTIKSSEFLNGTILTEEEVEEEILASYK